MSLAIQNKRILISAIVTILFILLLSFYSLYYIGITGADRMLVDLFFRLRGPTDAGKDIMIVALDRESAKQMQRKSSSWRRSDFAAAIENLTSAGADLIAIDYLFVIPDQDPAEDEELRKAMQESANVILASDISEQNRALPLSTFREEEIGEGFIDLFPDQDGILRQIPPLFAKRDEHGDLLIDFPFSVQVAVARIYPDGNFRADLTHPGFAQLGSLQIPYAGRKAGEGFLINFTGPPGHFPKIPFYQILRKEFRAQDVAGKIVLIGSMNPYYHDYYPVPFPSKERRNQLGIEQKSMRSMYGVEIHANAIHMMLNRAFLKPFSLRFLLAIFAVISILVTVIAVIPKWNSLILIAVSVTILVAFFLLSYWLFLSRVFVAGVPIYFAVILISLTGTIARQAEEAAQRRYITQLFGRYVAPNVVNELIRNRDLLEFNGRKQRLTIFFSDIRGFTSLSEKLPPEEVSALLNEYFSRMTRIVFKHGGTLDKFMGDAIMAFFGNPIYFTDHAKRAVSMALEMREEMQRLRSDWDQRGKQYAIDIGMGINTGEVVVGNLGSQEFFDYTVIGDDVNLACRLESIARKGQIILSASTYEEIKDQFEMIKLDPVTVKGKSQPVQIYEVIGPCSS